MIQKPLLPSEIPTEIQKSIHAIHEWCERSGFKNWQIGPLCSREFAFRCETLKIKNKSLLRTCDQLNRIAEEYKILKEIAEANELKALTETEI